MSCGVPGQDVCHEALIKAADTALYQAKHAGRDRAAAEPMLPRA